MKKLVTIPLLVGAIITFSTSTHAQPTDSPSYPDRMIMGTEKLGVNPYVLIDNKPYPSDILTRISPNCTASTTIIGDKKTAEKKYGPVAADGAVILTLKKEGLTYATATDRANLALERSAKNGFYYRLKLRHEDGTPYDKVVVNCASGQATSDEKTDCKVAFILDDKLYTEGQLYELQTRLKATKVGLSGVGNVPKPIPGVDLSGYDVTFYFYSKPVTQH